jgi:hypothetical protein
MFILSAIALGVATPAQARTYAVHQCGPWTPGFASAFGGEVADRCAQGGGIGLTPGSLTLSPWGSEWSQMGYRFTLPPSLPNARIVGVNHAISIASKTGDTTLSVGRLRTNGDGIFWGDELSIPAGPWAGVTRQPWARTGTGARTVSTIVDCYAPCDFSRTPSMELFAATITIDDPAAPAAPAAQPTGLLASGPQRGTRPLALTTSDTDSGIRTIAVTAGSTTLATSSLGCPAQATTPAPCPQSAARSLSIDTTKLRDGVHTLTATATDFAGNSASVSLPPVTVANAASSGTTTTGTGATKTTTGAGATTTAAGATKTTTSAETTPAAGAAGGTGASTAEPAKTTRLATMSIPAIALGLGAAAPTAGGAPNGSGGDPASGALVASRKRTKTTVGFKRKVVLRGRLIDRAGVPIGGATLDVFTAVGGAPATRVGETTTKPGGEYAWEVRPRANMQVALVYVGTRGTTTPQSSQELAITTRAGLTLSSARSVVRLGQRVELTGRVLNDGVPAAGVVVQIRALYKQRSLLAGVARTTPDGRFRWSRRFTESRGAIRLYARITRDPTLPAAPGSSRPVTVRIR